jgi:hypothetical protein
LAHEFVGFIAIVGDERAKNQDSTGAQDSIGGLKELANLFTGSTMGRSNFSK